MSDQTAVAHIGFDQELSDEAGMFFRCQTITNRRPRQTKAGQIQRNALVIFAQCVNDLAVQEAPRRVSVQKDHCRATALADVMKTRPVDIHETAFEREGARGQAEAFLGDAPPIGPRHRFSRQSARRPRTGPGIPRGLLPQ